jgi:hypothetical protein
MAMPRRGTEGLTVEKVHARFEDWRRNRKGRAAIPDELWLAAIEVARRDGVNRTAAALHLDGGKLKRRMVAADSAAGEIKPPAFVELLSTHSTGQPECIIELEGRNRKLRIHWNGATAADLAALSRALWEVAS